MQFFQVQTVFFHYVQSRQKISERAKLCTANYQRICQRWGLEKLLLRWKWPTERIPLKPISLPQPSSRGSKAVLSTRKSVNADSLGNWIPELFSQELSDMTQISHFCFLFVCVVALFVCFVLLGFSFSFSFFFFYNHKSSGTPASTRDQRATPYCPTRYPSLLGAKSSKSNLFNSRCAPGSLWLRTPTETGHQYSAEAFSRGLPWTQICHLVIVIASETPVYLFESAYPYLGGKFVLN